MRLLYVFFILLSISFKLVGQSVIYVDSAATGLGNGSSWTDAYPHLQPALENAQKGDTIWVARGTYYPSRDKQDSIPANQSLATFSMRNGVKVYGGFAGTETSLIQRNWRANPTVLHGRDTSNGNFAYSASVVNFIFCDSTTRLDGFEITSGYVSGYDPHLAGGGITIYYGNPVLLNLDVHHNATSGSQLSSGGLRIFRADPVLINCLVRNNQATGGHGGGFYINGSTSNPLFINCIIADNWAEHGGGGMFVKDFATPTFINCSFDGNTSNIGNGPQFRFMFSGVVSRFYNCVVNGVSELYNGAQAYHYHSLVVGSGGSQNWDSNFGIDMGANIDTLAFFKAGQDSLQPDYCSPLMDMGDSNYLPPDTYDLDYDGDTLEVLPFDFERKPRQTGLAPDMGAIEFGGLPDYRQLYLCGNDSLIVADSALFLPGLYQWSIPDSGGCDSLIRVSVAPVVQFNRIVNADSSFLVAADTAESYQWFECNTGQIFPGDTNQQFYPPGTGTYAVVLTKNGCTDTSFCSTFNYVSLSNASSPITLQIYPNPASNRCRVLTTGKGGTARVQIIDPKGRQVHKQELGASEASFIDLSKLPEGIYLMQVIKGGLVSSRRLVIQR